MKIRFVKTFIVLIMVALLLPSCKKDRESIYQDYKSSVVLIQTKYVYKVDYKGKTYFFKNPLELLYGNIENLSDNIKDFEGDPLIGYGTGFFISEDGRIITNRHVVDPLTFDEKEEISNELKKMQNSGLSELEEEKEKLQAKINEDNTELSVYPGYYNTYYKEKNIIKKRIQRNMARIESLNLRIREKKDDRNEGVKFGVKQISIGYALNNSHVDSDKDYVDVTLLKVSDKDKIDLAMLQTKDRIIPSRVEKTVSIVDVDKDNYVKENDQVFMIGYNYGEAIAKSSQGINVQINEGQISQKPADHKVLYSIPALEGSSGSPVFNEYGKIVAVNFAGINNNQGFNYGILAKDLKDFIR